MAVNNQHYKMTLKGMYVSPTYVTTYLRSCKVCIGANHKCDVMENTTHTCAHKYTKHTHMHTSTHRHTHTHTGTHRHTHAHRYASF